jgi:hypothetical protein
MDLLDKLALTMRRYEPRKTKSNHERRFELLDLMEMYSREAILELTASADGVFWTTRRPDLQRKLKVSLLDSVSDLRLPVDAWFRVGQTAPSGDYARARIEAYGRGRESLGHIEMLVGRRSYSYYFAQDPVLDQINAGATAGTTVLSPA